MYIKFDSALFTQEDMAEFIAALEKDGIKLILNQESFKHRKGLPEIIEEVSSWVASMENDFLPAFLTALFTFFVKHHKNDKNPHIQIDYRDGTTHEKVDIPLVDPDQLLKIELPVSQNGTIRIDIESSANPVQQENMQE